MVANATPCGSTMTAPVTPAIKSARTVNRFTVGHQVRNGKIRGSSFVAMSVCTDGQKFVKLIFMVRIEIIVQINEAHHHFCVIKVTFRLVSAILASQKTVICQKKCARCCLATKTALALPHNEKFRPYPSSSFLPTAPRRADLFLM